MIDRDVICSNRNPSSSNMNQRYDDEKRETPDDAYKRMLACLTGRTERKSRERAIKFPVKLMYALDCGDYSDIITWSEHGDFFMINDRSALEERVLPEIFKQAKCSSFLRKLYRWGFTRRRGGACTRQDDAYINPYFRRGDYASCRNIRCNGSAGGEVSEGSIGLPRPSLPPLGVPPSITSSTFQHSSQMLHNQGQELLQTQQNLQQQLNQNQKTQAQRSEESQQPQQEEMQSQLNQMYRQLEEQLLRHRLLQQQFISQLNSSQQAGAHSHSASHASGASGITNAMNGIAGSIMPYNLNQGSAGAEDMPAMPLLAAGSNTSSYATSASSAQGNGNSDSMMSQFENINNRNRFSFLPDNGHQNGTTQSSFLHHQFSDEGARSQSASLSTNVESMMPHANAQSSEQQQQQQLLNQFLHMSQPSHVNSINASSLNLTNQINDAHNEKIMLLDDLKGYEEEIQKNSRYR